jgi:hypothetical protein
MGHVVAETRPDGIVKVLLGARVWVTVRVRAEGYSPHEEAVDLKLVPRRHEMTVGLRAPDPETVLDLGACDDNGEPLSMIYLTLETPQKHRVPEFDDRVVLLGPGGHARIPGAPPGTYTATVSGSRFADPDSGYGIGVRRSLTIRPGETRYVEETLRTGGWIRLSVRGRDGKLVDRMLCFLRDGQGRHVAGMIDRRRKPYLQRPTPRVSDSPLPPGRYSLTVHAGAAEPETVPVVVNRGEVVDVEVSLLR